MTSRHTLTRVLGLAAMAFGMSRAVAFGEPLPAERIRDAATRAVAAVQASQAGWYEKQACISCHHQFQPAIAFRAARDHGIPIDNRIAAADAARAFDFSDLDSAIQFTRIVEPALQEGYRLIAANAAGVKPNLATAMAARFLIARQRPAGDWSGLNQRPPSSSSDFAKTAIALRAIQLFHHRADTAAAATAIVRATGWLTDHEAPDTEGLTYQLLGLRWSGAERPLLDRVGRTLTSMQRADGGWGSIDGRASEAYSTGEALVALHDAGVIKVSDAVYQRGLAFLLRTQAADGSWRVPSRLHDPARLSPPYFESGYPYGHDQFISVAGAAWSIMALAEALPAVASTVPAVPHEPPPPDLTEPWVETVLFGTIGDLRQLLDSGLDPNAATPHKTTALMMAASDPDKLRLLLDSGADVKARADSGLTALMVAAQYTHSDATIGLLLDRGALTRPDPNDRPTRTYGLALAAHAGNASILDRLHRAGDPVDAIFRLSPTGGGNPTPMAMAIRNGDLEVARTLLNPGVEVEGAKSEPWSSLESAVLNNRLDLVRLFLEWGADVNFVDKAGYTPLLLAASIDFGDARVIELLLESGARTSATTPTGETALELAREYQHTRFLGPLERAATSNH